jgi:nitrogen fixation/metabolism regulation signal transduction histidine kinase
MKRFLTALSIAAFAFAVSAQTQSNVATNNAGDLEALKVQLQSQIGGKLDNLSPEIQNKLLAAKQTMEQTRTQLRSMSGPNADAAKVQARVQADSALCNAIRTMEQVSAEVKAQVEKAKTEIQAQLQNRIEEAKMLQTKAGADNSKKPEGKYPPVPATGLHRWQTTGKERGLCPLSCFD